VEDQLQSDVHSAQRVAAIPTILDVICLTTGMGFAAVARVTEDRWIACRVLDNIAFGLAEGGELPARLRRSRRGQGFCNGVSLTIRRATR
jgi:hypothetical protein